MSLSPTNKVFLTGGLQDTGVKAGLQKFVPEIWGESIKDYMENYDQYLPTLRKQVAKLKKDFFSGEKLYGAIGNGS